MLRDHVLVHRDRLRPVAGGEVHRREVGAGARIVAGQRQVALEERNGLLVVALVVEHVGLAADRLAVVRVAREHVLEGRQRLRAGTTGRAAPRARRPCRGGSRASLSSGAASRLLGQVGHERLHLGRQLDRLRRRRREPRRPRPPGRRGRVRARLRRLRRQDRRPDAESRDQQQTEDREARRGESATRRRRRRGAAAPRGRRAARRTRSRTWRRARPSCRTASRSARQASGGTISEAARASKGGGAHSWRSATIGSSRAARRAG